MSPTVLIATLIRSYEAEAAGIYVDTRKGKSFKEPLCPLARQLIAAGHSPETRLHVTRDGLPVFKRDRTLAKWAGEDWRDAQKTSAYRSKYRPFTDGAGLNEASA